MGLRAELSGAGGACVRSPFQGARSGASNRSPGPALQRQTFPHCLFLNKLWRSPYCMQVYVSRETAGSWGHTDVTGRFSRR